MNEIKNETMPRTILLALLITCLVGISGVLYLVFRPGEKAPETIIALVEAESPAAAGINIMTVIDTLSDPSAVAEEGRRYRVRIADDAKEGASGIARIGGLVTFVPNTRRGDVVVVEVTRIKRSTADAVVIEVEERGPPSVALRRDERERPARSARPAVESEWVGKIFQGAVTDTGREGDGIVKVDGKVVFVAGARMGETVSFRITSDEGRFAHAEVVAGAPPAEAPTKKAEASTDAPVQVGELHEVLVSEPDRRHPDRSGVARIDNFVVFVPDAKVGEHVRIRITEVKARSAMAEVVERLPVPVSP